MNAEFRFRSRCGRAAFLAAVVCVAPRLAVADECPAAIANKACTVTIKRDKPVAPLPIRATSTATVTIEVTRRPLEEIVFEETLSDTAAPDILGAIFGAFSPGLQAVRTPQKDSTPVPEASVNTAREETSPVESALNDLHQAQGQLAASMNKVNEGIERSRNYLQTFANTAPEAWEPQHLTNFRRTFYCGVHGPKASIDCQCDEESAGSGTATLPVGTIRVLRMRLRSLTDQFQYLSSSERIRLGELLDDVSNNQRRLEASLDSLLKAQSALLAAAAIVKDIDTNNVDPKAKYTVGEFKPGANRQATIRIKARDMLSAEETELTTVVVVFGDTRWEVSGGVLFSVLPTREFANQPIIVNGVPTVSADGSQLTSIVETNSRPMVVPLVLTHFRLGEWPLKGQHRSAFLVSGGIGVNPYSGSADFVLGVSLGLRGLMISPMLHWAQDHSLTGGLKPGQELGASPPTLTTQRFWVQTWGVALTYRIPVN